ncbi:MULTISPECIES: phosphoenolpyruvate--protein phosphotransferase [unclassified Sphingomonas]|uniref:phosphoenolpyruvate--protein phosphotransferase n=1 Tax=unclassified Sphingomonas TaxID=196159 RepID=UPI00226AEA04|nr:MULTISPECIES: phosphoenolpyruvate--protein phosphotransferase [unclassified Sphingomonas]
MASIILTAPLAGLITPLANVPDAVFADRMLGDGVAIDPTGDCLYAPCAATVIGVQPTGHAITLVTTDGVELLIHIGLDTVALGGSGFEPCVQPGDTVAAGAPLIRFDLDRLVCAARAVVTPIVVTNMERFSIVDCTAAGEIAVGAALMTLEPRETGAVASAVASGEQLTRSIVVPLAHGLHARPAARLGEAAKRFRAEVTIIKDGQSASARSPIGLLALGIGHQDKVTVAAVGDDAAAALAAVADLIVSGMGETAAAVPVAAAAPVTAARDVPSGAIAGVTAAAGLAIGQAGLFRATDLAVPEQGQGIADEEAQLEQAIATLRADLATRQLAATGAAQSILAAHLSLLDDPALLTAARHGIAQGHGAAHAWREAIRPQADALRRLGDPRLAERADDMLDLERQLIALIMGIEAMPLAFPPGTVLIAEDLLPSDLLSLDRGNVVGFCVERGGPTSHVAILAASMGLPALVAMGTTLHTLAEGTRLILDADDGLLHVDPDDGAWTTAAARVAAARDRRAEQLARAAALCHMADGTRIEAFANLGSVEDARQAVACGAEGSGLLRTEFLFLERAHAPDLAEQTAEYQAIADALEGRPLIVRLLDIGGDKPVAYLPIPAEENPALGLRGIRVGLAQPALLEQQLRAILAVTPRGQCRIMLPMIASVDELRQVRTLLDGLVAELAIAEPVQLGVMVETPAAAVTADLLAAEADFLSVGTNDLTQYALAMDRGNPAVAAALDGLHPAVLRLIAQTCDGAGRHDRWVGVCGGLASDPLAIPILLGLGVTELSSAPAMVPEIKALVATLTLEACRQHAAAALGCRSAAEVRTLAREFRR